MTELWGGEDPKTTRRHHLQAFTPPNYPKSRPLSSANRMPSSSMFRGVKNSLQDLAPNHSTAPNFWLSSHEFAEGIWAQVGGALGGFGRFWRVVLGIDPGWVF